MPDDARPTDAEDAADDARRSDGPPGVNESLLGTPLPIDPLASRALMVRWHGLPDEELDPRQAEMRRLARAARLMIERLVGTSAPAEAIARAADDLTRFADELGAPETVSIYEGYAEVANAGGDAVASFEHSPFIGLANPLSPPVRIEGGERGVSGTVRFGAAYEGPPGCVHGGYIAGVFDEVLGAAQTYSGWPGMTGTLTVWYRSPTPLHTDLRITGEFVRTEGRRIYTKGSLWAGERLCAEAEGIFVSVDASRFATLIEERQEREARRSD
jgi:acyl-coenzyme A thioesterase PaaI-like protein